MERGVPAEKGMDFGAATRPNKARLSRPWGIEFYGYDGL